VTFSGKVAFITGGGSGMGQLAARNLAAKGVRVAVLDVNTSGLSETAAGFDNILTFPADVTEPADIEQAVKRVEQAWNRSTAFTMRPRSSRPGACSNRTRRPFGESWTSTTGVS
jgi:NAD(P)-dependent dehydrogenase (short-subunit alcohol dehydrogenase family)